MFSHISFIRDCFWKWFLTYQFPFWLILNDFTFIFPPSLLIWEKLVSLFEFGVIIRLYFHGEKNLNSEHLKVWVLTARWYYITVTAASSHPANWNWVICQHKMKQNNIYIPCRNVHDSYWNSNLLLVHRNLIDQSREKTYPIGEFFSREHCRNRLLAFSRNYYGQEYCTWAD